MLRLETLTFVGVRYMPLGRDLRDRRLVWLMTN
jgi:hypothetical protein